ncbi:MAG: histidine phosphatase family protein [Betaproteobacteria bacterium RBG_16_66_20]|nr:MAG: histidine phosphatase family protein [Betaproteobacteria bacterium RBG_16_66_20]
MELILWRHADAEEGARDMERKLTGKGRKQAARVAQWLQRRLPSKFTLLCSPARRARETADALEQRYKISDRLAPGAQVADLVEAAGWPERKGLVILVGHQPDFGRAAAALVTGEQADWSVKKGGLWWLESRVRGGDARVTVRAVIAPDLV